MGRRFPTILKPIIMDGITAEFVMQLKEWHQNNIDQLEMVKNTEGSIKFESKNGDQIELPKEHIKGFKYGIEVALTVLGEFPIKIEQDKSNQEN